MPFDAISFENDTSVVLHLQMARALLSKRANWCKNAEVEMNAKGHYSYCAVGALKQFSHIGYSTICYLDAASQKMGYPSIVYFNDLPATKHRQILKAFDIAIALAQKDHA